MACKVNLAGVTLHVTTVGKLISQLFISKPVAFHTVLECLPCYHVHSVNFVSMPWFNTVHFVMSIIVPWKRRFTRIHSGDHTSATYPILGNFIQTIVYCIKKYDGAPSCWK
jgi:hypothetical protein